MLRFGVARLLILGLVGLALASAALATAPTAVAHPGITTTETSIDVVGAITARRLDDGRVEFAFRPSGGARIFPEQRYVPADAASNSWLVSSDVTHVDDTLGRIIARRLDDGQMEFGFRVEGGDELLPELRFVPAVTSGGWLRSSELSFSVAPPDLAPEFSATLGDQTFNTRGETTELTLPAAEGGDGALSYMLLPVVPGLSFDAQLRRLAGTPSRVGTYLMVYRVADADGDIDELRFMIDVVYERVASEMSDDAMDDGSMAGDDASQFPESGGGPQEEPAEAEDSAVKGGSVSPLRPTTPRDTTFVDNPRSGFTVTAEDSTSTFSLDVDRTSYFLALNWANARYQIDPDSVRAEEWINAFDYGYGSPTSDDRFAITTALVEHPTAAGVHLARIAFQAPELPDDAPLNVTLVLDASGSMARGNRVGIARAAAEAIRGGLREGDQIAVVQFSDNVLRRYTVRPTHPDDERVTASIRRLRPTSSTNVQAGLDLGLWLAGGMRHERPDAINYIILMSDGVANVDATDPFAILEATGDREPSNPIRLITVGVGIENYNDYLLEQLAQHGNGWYRYLDTSEQARQTFSRANWLALSRPFADQTRAQVEWDSSAVAQWRLVGYENRVTSDESFTEDRNEFAEIPSGVAVTVFYELELTEGTSAAQADLGGVELRWLTPRSGESNSQAARISGAEDGDASTAARRELGALVALAADRYGSLTSVDDDAGADVRAELERLGTQLDALEPELGSLDAYGDFRLLLSHLIARLPAAPEESGYRP